MAKEPEFQSEKLREDYTAVALFTIAQTKFYLFFTDGTQEYYDGVFTCRNNDGDYTVVGDIITRRLTGDEKTFTQMLGGIWNEKDFEGRKSKFDFTCDQNITHIVVWKCFGKLRVDYVTKSVTVISGDQVEFGGLYLHSPTIELCCLPVSKQETSESIQKALDRLTDEP